VGSARCAPGPYTRSARFTARWLASRGRRESSTLRARYVGG
jgi:hypothetical protein